MIERETAIINQFSTSRAEVVAASRFFNNEAVDLEALIEATRAACAAQCAGRRVLAIQDTTEINYSAHEGLLKASDPEIGPVGNDRDAGFFLHPTLVLDADTGLALGCADVEVHNRRWDKQDKHERDYRNQPIEAKESYRWIESGRQAKATLTGADAGADQVTIIADREGDIYHLLATMPDERTDVLVRTRSDRRLADAMQTDARTLYAHIDTLPIEGSYTLDVPGTNGRKPRQAKLYVRFGPVAIAKPRSNHQRASLPETVQLWGVEARELPRGTVPRGTTPDGGALRGTAPDDEKPIRWRLLTSRPVQTFAQALAVIGDYSKRMQIEQVFRLLKSEGLRVERSQLACGAALKRLSILGLQVSLTLMQLVSGRSGPAGDEPATTVFDRETFEFMNLLRKKLEGATAKQKCPHPQGTLAWGSWIVGRLGGWDGYASGDPPGPITMRRGVERLISHYAGWQLAHGQ